MFSCFETAEFWRIICLTTILRLLQRETPLLFYSFYYSLVKKS